MSQCMLGQFGDRIDYLYLPDANQEVLPGVLWGRFENFFTPAYWKGQYWQVSATGGQSPSFRIGETLAEEAAACCLGGHGIPAEVGLIAFQQLKRHGLLAVPDVSPSTLYEILGGTLSNGKKTFRYRFAKQKSSYLAPILRAIHANPPNETDVQEFRKWFLKFKGIGPKTASWITRNWLGSPEVAILDIHIYRAGLLCSLFQHGADLTRDYFKLESLFLAFAQALEASAALLDALIWDQFRQIRFNNLLQLQS